MIEGAIFDVDGTLLDSMQMWDSVGVEYIKAQGFVPEPNLSETFKTFSLRQAAQYFIDKYKVDKTVDEICNGVNAMVEDGYRHKVLIKDGIKDLLEGLKQRNVKMCIATATDEYLVEAALKRNGIYDYFSNIFTCPAVGHGKDEPVIYRECLKSLGTNKAKTIVLEDVLYAVNTAKSDGFNVVGVYDKFEPKQDEIRNRADIFLPNYKELDKLWDFVNSL